MTMSEAPHPDLQRALDLSGRMLAAARAGDWAAATEHQGECDRLLRQATVNAAGLMALRQLYRDQQELLGMAAQARQATGGDLVRQRLNHRAVSAYIKTSDAP
jgi:hypothetical protein